MRTYQKNQECEIPRSEAHTQKLLIQNIVWSGIKMIANINKILSDYSSFNIHFKHILRYNCLVSNSPNAARFKYIDVIFHSFADANKKSCEGIHKTHHVHEKTTTNSIVSHQ